MTIRSIFESIATSARTLRDACEGKISFLDVPIEAFFLGGIYYVVVLAIVVLVFYIFLFILRRSVLT